MWSFFGLLTHTSIRDFADCSVGKESTCNAGDSDSIPGLGPWWRKWQPTPVFLPEKFHGQRSLVGCSPWGHKELDTTEHMAHSTQGYGVVELTWKALEFTALNIFKMYNIRSICVSKIISKAVMFTFCSRVGHLNSEWTNPKGGRKKKNQPYTRFTRKVIFIKSMWTTKLQRWRENCSIKLKPIFLKEIPLEVWFYFKFPTKC